MTRVSVYKIVVVAVFVVVFICLFSFERKVCEIKCSKERSEKERKEARLVFFFSCGDYSCVDLSLAIEVTHSHQISKQKNFPIKKKKSWKIVTWVGDEPRSSRRVADVVVVVVAKNKLEKRFTFGAR